MFLSSLNFSVLPLFSSKWCSTDKTRLLAALEKEITLKVIQLEPQDVKSGIDMLIPLLYDRLPPEIDNTQKVKFTVKL